MKEQTWERLKTFHSCFYRVWIELFNSSLRPKIAADTSLAENVVLEMTPSTALSRPVVSKLMSMTAVGRSSTLIDHGRHVERQPNSLSSQGTDTMPWFLLDPDGSLRTFWDGLMVLALFYTLIYMPLRVAFNSSESWDASDLTIDIIFFLDIIVSILSPFQRIDDSLETNWSTILVAYFSSWFVIDIFTCLPFYLLPQASGLNHLSQLSRLPRILKVLRLLRLLKLTRTARFRLIIEYFEDSTNLHPSSVRILKLAFGVVAFAHVASCVWIYLAHSEEVDNSVAMTWLNAYGFVDSQNDAATYLCALYWFIVTFATLGYGDIVPKSDLERSFAMLVIVIGFCVYSYLTATLATIIRASDHNVDRYREKVSMMTTFMQQNRVPLTLQSKLRKHFRTRYGNETSPLDVDAVMADVPLHLRSQLSMSLYGDALKRTDILRLMRNSAFVDAVAIYTTSRHYDEGEIIATEGEAAREWFILLKGVVHAETLFGTCLYRVDPGAAFGEAALLITKCWNATMRCRCDVEVLAVPKASLFKLLAEYPLCAEVMQRSAVQRMERVDVLRRLIGTEKANATEDELSMVIMGGKSDPAQPPAQEAANRMMEPLLQRSYSVYLDDRSGRPKLPRAYTAVAEPITMSIAANIAAAAVENHRSVRARRHSSVSRGQAIIHRSEVAESSSSTLVTGTSIVTENSTVVKPEELYDHSSVHQTVRAKTDHISASSYSIAAHVNLSAAIGLPDSPNNLITAQNTLRNAADTTSYARSYFSQPNESGAYPFGVPATPSSPISDPRRSTIAHPSSGSVISEIHGNTAVVHSQAVTPRGARSGMSSFERSLRRSAIISPALLPMVVPQQEAHMQNLMLREFISLNRKMDRLMAMSFEN